MTLPRDTGPKISNDFSRARARTAPEMHQATTSIWFKFVKHSEILLYLAKGWSISDDLVGTSHGHWSILMQYDGEGEPT